MAVLIRNFGVAECIAVEPVSAEAAKSWSVWRQNYIGLIGILEMYESQNLYPGQCYLYFSGELWDEYRQNYDDWYLKTSLGELIEDSEQIVFVTPNSRYVFRLIVN